MHPAVLKWSCGSEKEQHTPTRPMMMMGCCSSAWTPLCKITQIWPARGSVRGCACWIQASAVTQTQLSFQRERRSWPLPSSPRHTLARDQPSTIISTSSPQLRAIASSDTNLESQHSSSPTVQSIATALHPSWLRLYRQRSLASRACPGSPSQPGQPPLHQRLAAHHNAKMLHSTLLLLQTQRGDLNSSCRLKRHNVRNRR